MPASAVNDCMRAYQGALRRMFDQKFAQVTTTGTANAQVLTFSVAPGALAFADVFFFEAGITNTGATTLNINSLGAKAIQWAGSALIGGEIVSGQCYGVRYDGTQFQLIWHPLPPRVIPQTTFAPTDQSGPSFTLTTDCKWSQDGELVSFYGRVTYPNTGADANPAAFSIPIAATGASTHQHGTCVIIATGGAGIFYGWVNSGGQVSILKSTGAAAHNADLSGLTLDFFLRYPVT